MMQNDQSGKQAGGKKFGQGGSAAVSPATIQKFLKGMDYPCSKGELLDQARENGAPDDVMYVLNQLEDRDYDSPADVERDVGRIE